LKVLPFQSPPGGGSREQALCGVLLDSLDALYSTAHRLTGKADLAEDLVQETARKALEGSSALRDERNLRGWLFKILINSSQDRLRRNQLWEELNTESEEVEPDAGLESLAQATVQDVRSALSHLTPARRALVILVDLEEFTMVEAADMLKIPAGTAASRLARAHQELRDLLNAYRTKQAREKP
jgi:RNA polymerase sigma-70 factor, ECF subfamily